MANGKNFDTSCNLLQLIMFPYIQVTDFFTAMNTHKDFKAGFDHPDPEEHEKGVDFCKYWGVS
jgi:hypothetical protein